MGTTETINQRSHGRVASIVYGTALSGTQLNATRTWRGIRLHAGERDHINAGRPDVVVTFTPPTP